MKTALVTGGTKNDIDAIATLVINVQRVTPNLADEIVIFHDGVDKDKQKLINNIMPARFVYYKSPFSKMKMWKNKSIRYFSPMIFCKYECFRLLKEYDTVIWTDYDVVIKNDISELKTMDEQMQFILAKEVTLKDMFNEKINSVDMEEYDMDGICITAPLMVLSKELKDYEKYYHWCIEMTDKYMKYLYLPEQCIYTMLVQKFNLSYGEIEKEIYCLHPKYATEKTKIHHAYGQPKYWNGLYDELWVAHNKIWLNMINGVSGQ